MRKDRLGCIGEVYNQASPDHSRKTDGSSGMDLTQKKREGRMSVRLGLGIGIGIALTRHKGVGGFGSGYRCWECINKMQGSRGVWECIAKM